MHTGTRVHTNCTYAHLQYTHKRAHLCTVYTNQYTTYTQMCVLSSRLEYIMLLKLPIILSSNSFYFNPKLFSVQSILLYH